VTGRFLALGRCISLRGKNHFRNSANCKLRCRQPCPAANIAYALVMNKHILRKIKKEKFI